MRLRGRRLTMVLTIVLLVVLGGGASAAWALGRTRPGPMPDGYAAGPSASESVEVSSAAGLHPRAGEVRRTLQTYFDAINRRDFQAWLGYQHFFIWVLLCAIPVTLMALFIPMTPRANVVASGPADVAADVPTESQAAAR